MAFARIYARGCQVQEKLLEVASLGGRRIYVPGVLGWLLSLKYLVRCHHGAKATGRSDAAVGKEGGYLEGAT